MIVVQDDFLESKDFTALQELVKRGDWQIFDTGDKKFSYIDTPMVFYEHFEMEGHELFLSFIRRSYYGFDDEPRIHADHVINGHMTSLASVLYLSDNEGLTPNGTRFHEHVHYGRRLPQGISDEEHDFVLKKHCNDLSKWKDTDTIRAFPNRILTYDANLFHSKWPPEIEEGQRNVLVNFYREI